MQVPEPEKAIDDDVSGCAAVYHGAFVECYGFLGRMESVAVRVEGDVPYGCFLFWSKPASVFSRPAAVSAVDDVFMFGVVTVPGDDWKVFVPNH